jgi:hypothetical protein
VARDRRAVLVEHAVTSGLVSPDDLGLLAANTASDSIGFSPDDS